MTPGTSILVPVLGRPHRVGPLVENIEENTPELHDIVFVASDDDSDEINEIVRVGRQIMGRETAQTGYMAPHLILVDPDPGTWAVKINAGFRATSREFVFLGADDLNFHPGWLGEARRVMDASADDFASRDVVGTNDLCNPRTMNGTHSTHMLVRRSYIDEVGGVIDQPPGVVLNEAYPHDYVDDEFHETARFRGVYAHAFDSHVEHLHPLCGKGKMDETYRRGLDIGPVEGRRIYESRCSLWGGGLPRRLRKKGRTRRG